MCSVGMGMAVVVVVAAVVGHGRSVLAIDGNIYDDGEGEEDYASQDDKDDDDDKGGEDQVTTDH